MSEYTRRDVREFRRQYREFVIEGDLAGFEALLDAYAPQLDVSEKRAAIETFTRDAANALRFRWRASK
jgi:hypothetical protein